LADVCAVCEEYYWDNDETQSPVYNCTEEGHGEMRYTNKCKDNREPYFCGSGDQACLWSYPWDDEDKWSSIHAACRNVPDEYVGDLRDEANWFHQSRSKNKSKGLCGWFGCDGTCHQSWPQGDSRRGKGPKSLARCMPADITQ